MSRSSLKYLPKKEPPIPFTQKGYDEVLKEKQKLLTERPDAVENLRKAREMGDLSENGYYKAARARLSFIDARLRYMEKLVKRGVVVQTKVGNTQVEIGNTVTLKDGEKEVTYTVVGGYESDPANNTISHISPIGKALMHKKEGEVIIVHAPVGTKTFTIHSIV